MCWICTSIAARRETVLADEDDEQESDRWYSHTPCCQEFAQILAQWVWNLRLSLGKGMQGNALREIEWAPPKATTLLLLTPEPVPEEYGPWQWAAQYAGRFGGDAFSLQENGTLRCPAGASLWLSEVCQENAFTQRATYVAFRTDCQKCSLKEQCLASKAKGDRARRVSAVRRLLPQPSSVEHKPVVLGPMRWVDVAGRALRRAWTAHWRQQYVEVLPLPQVLPERKPPPRSPAISSHLFGAFQKNAPDRLFTRKWRPFLIVAPDYENVARTGWPISSVDAGNGLLIVS
jgi:hypothetical protein